MSEAVSALGNVTWSEGLAKIEEFGPLGMITLRGDLTSKTLQKAAAGVAGVAFPNVRKAACDGERGLLWMSPDELMVLCPYADVTGNLAQLQTSLGSEHALAVNVSDARAVFRVSGASAREVMAKLSPVDLSSEAFGPGDFRRSRLAQVAAAYWMRDDETFEIICFRSVAAYVFDLLKVAAQPGSHVGYFD